MQSRDKNRLTYIDIVKAIAMISIVVFHSCTNNGNTYLATNAYLIRVTSAYGLPVFFFVNGFLFHNKDVEHPIRMIWKKIKSYYLPFLCYNLFFWAFHNVFVLLHMLDEQHGGGWYSVKDYLIQFVKAVTGHREYFAGALWFLGSILIINTIVIICEFFIAKFFRGKYHDLFLGIVACMFMVVGNSGYVTDKMKIATSLCNLIYFYLGMIYKKYNLNEVLIRRKYVCIAFGVVLDLLISYNKLYNPFACSSRLLFIVLDYVNAFFCIAAIMMISQLPLFMKSKVLKLIGENTLDIMGLHFMLFKIVSLIIICVYQLPIERLAEYPVLMGVEGGWWILYSVVGVSLATLFAVIRHKYLKVRRR